MRAIFASVQASSWDGIAGEKKNGYPSIVLSLDDSTFACWQQNMLKHRMGDISSAPFSCVACVQISEFPSIKTEMVVGESVPICGD